MSAPGPRPTAPGSGSEFRPWNAHPVDGQHHATADDEHPPSRNPGDHGCGPSAGSSMPDTPGAGGGGGAGVDGGGGSGIAAPGIRPSGTDGAGPVATGSPGRPV